MEFENIKENQEELPKVKSLKNYLFSEPMFYLPIGLLLSIGINVLLFRIFILAFTMLFSFVDYVLNIVFWAILTIVSLYPTFELFQELKHYLELRKVRRSIEIESIYTLAETMLVPQQNSEARKLILRNFRRFQLTDEIGEGFPPIVEAEKETGLVEVLDESNYLNKIELFEDSTGEYYYRIIGLEGNFTFKVITEWKKKAFEAFASNPSTKTNQNYLEKKEIYDYCLMLRNNKMIKDFAKKHNIVGEKIKVSFVEPKGSSNTKTAWTIVGKADSICTFINKYIAAVENKINLPEISQGIDYKVEYRWKDNTQVNRVGYGCVFEIQKNDEK